MKQALAILVVIAFVVSLSVAAVYQPTKDTFYRFDTNTGGGGPGTDTYGGANAQRAGKGWQDGFYMDFDRAAILADASAALGYTATAADFTSGNVTVTLQLMSAGWGFNHSAAYTPGYFTSTTNWTESGASFNMADQVNGVAWNGGGSNGDMRDCPLHLTASGGQVWAAGDSTYQTFTIPADTATGFLFATTEGVALEMNGADWSNNGAVYSREGLWIDGVTYAGPKLTVTVVPEPCSMLLIAAGAVATLIRRRK